MLLGPIFTAELRSTSRRKRYFLLRAVYAACLLAVLWLNYRTAFSGQFTITTTNLSLFAREFFRSFALLQAGAIFLVTPAMFAGAIAEDRERRTIDYLLTSELTSSDIVLGKLGVRACQAVVLLTTGMGFLAMSLIFGGVDAGNLLIATVAAGVLVFELAAVSIFISTWTRRSRHALRNAYLIILLWSAAPFLAAALSGMTPTSTYFDVLAISPLGYYAGAISGIIPFLPTAACHFGFAVACVVATILSFRRAYAWGEKPIGTRPLKFAPQARRPFRGSNPMRWKETFTRRRWTWIRIGVAIVAIWAPLVAFFITGRWEIVPELVMYISVVLLSIALLLVSVRAASSVTVEVERECWTMLLSSSLSAREIVFEKAWGAMHSVTSIVLFVSFGWLCCALVVEKFIWALIFQWAIFAPTCAFCAFLGVRFSLRSSKSIVAISKTLSVLAILTVSPFVLRHLILWSSNYREEWGFAFSPPMLLGLAVEQFTISSYSYRWRGNFVEPVWIFGGKLFAFAAMWLAVRCVWKFNSWTGRIPGVWLFWWRHFPTFARTMQRNLSIFDRFVARLPFWG